MKKTVIHGLVLGLFIGTVAGCGGGSADSGQNASLLANGEACAPAWNASTVYSTAGIKVNRNGRNYTSAYWTQGNDPATRSGPAGSGEPWIPGYLCGSATPAPTPTPTPAPTPTPTPAPTPTPTPAPTPTGAVTLFQDCNYGGAWSADFGTGSYRLSDIIARGGRNDDASSIRIPAGYTVTMYKDDNFTGTAVTLTGDNSCFVGLNFNDVLSSMIVSTSSTPAPTPAPTPTPTPAPTPAPTPTGDGSVWKGHNWEITNGGMAGVVPGSPSNVFVDSNGYLHLKISKSGSSYTAAEMFSKDRMGFGTYQWQIEGNIDNMDKSTVLGLFPYGPAAGIGSDGENEIDIEFSKWNNTCGCNADFTYYPSTGNGGLGPVEDDFTISLNGGNLTTARIEWRSNKIVGTIMSGLQPIGTTANVLRTFTLAPSDTRKIPQVPLPLGMNLWAFQATPASNQEVIIRDFQYQP